MSDATDTKANDTQTPASAWMNPMRRADGSTVTDSKQQPIYAIKVQEGFCIARIDQVKDAEVRNVSTEQVAFKVKESYVIKAHRPRA